MSHKVHSSQGNVPFSWENKPGVSKKNQDDRPEDSTHHALKLPPPPCLPPEDSSRTRTHHHFHDLQVPLPPCGFQPPSRIGSSKGLRRQDDPFLSAYLECTKSSRKGRKFFGGGKSGFGFGLRNKMTIRKITGKEKKVTPTKKVKPIKFNIKKPKVDTVSDRKRKRQNNEDEGVMDFATPTKRVTRSADTVEKFYE